MRVVSADALMMKEIAPNVYLVDEEVIRNAPTFDAEPVVRCKECEHHHWGLEPCHGKTVHYCDLPEIRSVEIYKDFFCGFGKQKGGERKEK